MTYDIHTHNLSMSCKPRVLLPLLALGLFSFSLTSVAQPSSDCRWAAGIYARDFDKKVEALELFDDGTGPAIYAAGDFGSVEGKIIEGIARWDGAQWSPVLGQGGGGVSGLSGEGVVALEVWDDGEGPALFAAGLFDSADGKTTTNIARWNGTDWAPLPGAEGEGVDGKVITLKAWGDSLFLGGEFEAAGGKAIAYLARWDGSEWFPVEGASGEVVDDWVEALEVWDDGNGPALFAAGSFSVTSPAYGRGEVEIASIARWQNNDWQALGSEVDGDVLALETFAGQLIVGGQILEVGGEPAGNLMTWDGNQWTALEHEALDLGVVELAVSQDGSRLYVSAIGLDPDDFGDTSEAGRLKGVPIGEVGVLESWDGVEWSSLVDSQGLGISGTALALQPWHDGVEETLWLGGELSRVGDQAARGIGTWDGTHFNALPSLASGVDVAVYDSVVWDDGTGPALYAVGSFRIAGTTPATGIARWDGQGWEALPGFDGSEPSLQEIVVYDGALIVSGNFTSVGGITVNNIARWDGMAWSALTGSSGTGTDGDVSSLLVDGDTLYLAGFFDQAGGLPAANIARWDGSDFAPLGLGLSSSVYAMALWDDGDGLDLYVGGGFSSAGGATVNRIARWDGATWASLTDVSGTGVDGIVRSLAPWQDKLYVTGGFTHAGGTAVNRIASWDGTQWATLTDSEGAVGINSMGLWMTAHDDGTGSRLVVGATDHNQGQGAATTTVAQWDGDDWHGLEDAFGAPDGPVLDVGSLDLGAGPFLAAGGNFDSVGNKPTGGFSLWSCDAIAPTAPPLLHSTTHEPEVLSTLNQITVEWEEASDTGPLGLWGYSWIFDHRADTEPDDQLEALATEGILTTTSDALETGIHHWFHLKTCDRNANCTVSHLGPFWIDPTGGLFFADGFESGDLAAWSSAIP